MARFIRLLLVALLLSFPAAAADVAAGLTEALVVGASRTVDRLGRPNGFLSDRRFRIPLPGPVEQLRPVLGLAGLSGMADDLELRMNRAAEAAIPIAKDLVIRAIRGMTFEDAVGILRGPSDSATRYLERRSREPLAQAMRPIVDRALADAGAVKTLDGLLGSARSLPMAGNLDLDLTGHVVQYAQRALFGYLADEEAAIRTNPAARTTDLLRSVFGR